MAANKKSKIKEPVVPVNYLEDREWPCVKATIMVFQQIEPEMEHMVVIDKDEYKQIMATLRYWESKLQNIINKNKIKTDEEKRSMDV